MTLHLTMLSWIMTPKTQGARKIKGKLDVTKISDFCTSEDTINRMKRQLKRMEENIYESFTWEGTDTQNI